METNLRDLYLRQLKSHLRLSRSHRRSALFEVMGTVDDYLEQVSEPSWEEMTREIGTPEDVAVTLNAEYPEDATIRRTRSWMIVIIFIIIAIFYYLYHTHAYKVYYDPTVYPIEQTEEIEEYGTWSSFE